MSNIKTSVSPFMTMNMYTQWKKMESVFQHKKRLNISEKVEKF